MAAPKQIFEGFSLSHAQVLTGAETFIAAAFAAYNEDFDIYGVNSGNLTPDTDSFENNGDDATLSRWEWLNFAELEVQAGYISLPVYETITGRAATTTASTIVGNTAYGMDIWHENDFNVASKPMILKMPSKDSAGAVRQLVIGLYKVAFGPITFEGPEYKEGLKVNYTGTALMSTLDEAGVAFSDGKKRVGRLLSIGSAAPAI